MSLVPRIARPVVTYGIESDADVRAVNIVRHEMQTRFDVQRRGSPGHSSIQLNLPGMHNVLNSLAAIAVAIELGFATRRSRRHSPAFHGVDRRLQQYGDVQTAVGSSR